MPITLAVTSPMFPLGYPVLQLPMAWAGHVSQPKLQLDCTQGSETQDAPSMSSIVISIDTKEKIES